MTPSEFRIRRASANDLGALMELQRLYVDAWSRTVMRDALGSGGAEIFVAERRGVPVGFAALHVVCGDAELDQLFVHPDYRRRGAARALVEYVESQAAEKHADRLILEVRRSNGIALQLYQNLGFQALSTRVGYYRNPDEDAQVLSKKLNL